MNIDPMELPYVADVSDLAEAVTTISNGLLWRLCGYDERKPTPEDVAEVLDALDAGRDAFLRRASTQIDNTGHRLHIVKDAS